MNTQIEHKLEEIHFIISEKWEEGSTLGERCGAFAALQHLGKSLREILEEQCALDGYTAQKISQVIEHGSGALGFGERSSFPPNNERSLAMGDLSVLRSVLGE